MLALMTAMALAAAAQTAPAAPAVNPHSQHMQTGMDHSKMDHSRMGQMNMAQHGNGCCKTGADGKMECAMFNKAGAGSTHQGHNGN